MSYLNKKGKIRSIRHKSYKKVKKNRRSVKHTRKINKRNRMKHRSSMKRRSSMRSRRNKYQKTRHASYGYKYSYGKGRTFRGGSGLRSLLPMELVNLGDNIRTGISSVAHDFVGSVHSPSSPMAHLDHPIDRNDEFILPKVADVEKIYNESAANVAKLYS
jgi:hypothetical protein